jgi:hypothetical protein
LFVKAFQVLKTIIVFRQLAYHLRVQENGTTSCVVANENIKILKVFLQPYLFFSNFSW